MTNSNDQGRAFEFAVVRALLNAPGVTTNRATLQMQGRDAPKFNALSQPLQSRFQEGAEALREWLFSESLIGSGSSVERFQDSYGIAGDATDLAVTTMTDHETLISLKHNNHSLKHPRPRPIAERFGYQANDPIGIRYRQRVEAHRMRFARISSDLGVATFAEVKALEPSAVSTLYAGICEELRCLYNEADVLHRTKWLDWILGAHPGAMIAVLESSGLAIYSYGDIVIPSASAEAYIDDRGYVCIPLDGTTMTFRLHNASSRVHNVPLKYDVKLHRMPEPVAMVSL